MQNNFNIRRFAILGYIILAVLLSFCSINNLGAQPNNNNSLNRIADIFLGNWVGEGNAPEGGKFTTALKFEWTLNKKFINVKNTINIGGKSQLFAETFYGWHPILQRVLFWSFDNDGSINEGTTTVEGNTIHHDWRSFTGNGQIRELRSRLTRNSKNEATFTLLEPRDGEWVETHTIKYKREK